MLRLLPIALRNIGRNRRRTLLTLAAVVFGVVAAMAQNGFLNGLIGMMLGRMVEGRIGAIQVHHVGFLKAEEDPLKLDLPLDDALLARLRAVPGVTGVSPRITFQGMLSNGSTQALAEVTAVDPVHEEEVCPGRWRDAKAKPLDPANGSGAVVGKALADGLSVKPGAALTLMATSKPGPPNVLDLALHDVAGTTNPLDSKRGVTVQLAWAQELLRMPGRVTELAIGVESLSKAEEVAVRVRAALGPEYEVSTWGELIPAIRDALQLLKAVLGLVMSVLALLVVTGIANTMLMSVFERVREVGTMLAVGVTRRQVVSLFVAESAFIGLLGAIVGAILGTLLVAVLHAKGIPIRPPGTDVPALIRPVSSAGFAPGAIVVAVLGAIAAAAYPAWRASKLSPVDALRSN